ncbi:MAG: GntG family PLP-dependent aldolase [bacterium]
MKTQDLIDLRSDTVTRPTPEMRMAMASCEVGDDVFGDDPTVIALEKKAVELTGTEASLWCPTGTMANQVAIATHTHPGQEVVVGNGSHIFNYELGGVGWNSLCQVYNISDEMGWPNPESIKNAIRTETMHTPGTGLVCIENTHNRRGGRVMPFDIFKACTEYAHEKGIPVHLDGARIWNASVASGIPVPDYTARVGSMMFCLSKGLASPAGSMLCGTTEFIGKARRIRKRMGGGLRQAGVLAACGLISLEKMINRLEEDHKTAKALANAIAKTGVLKIEPEKVETNILILSPPDTADWNALDFETAARKLGLLVTFMGEKHIRMVTHNDFSAEQVGPAVEKIVNATKVAVEK